MTPPPLEILYMPSHRRNKDDAGRFGLRVVGSPLLLATIDPDYANTAQLWAILDQMARDYNKAAQNEPGRDLERAFAGALAKVETK